RRCSAARRRRKRRRPRTLRRPPTRRPCRSAIAYRGRSRRKSRLRFTFGAALRLTLRRRGRGGLVSTPQGEQQHEQEQEAQGDGHHVPGYSRRNRPRDRVGMRSHFFPPVLTAFSLPATTSPHVSIFAGWHARRRHTVTAAALVLRP